MRWLRGLAGRVVYGPFMATMLLLVPARSAEVAPVPPTALRADAAAGPDPFVWAPSGATALPAPVTAAPPDNVAHLALLRPYTVAFGGAPAVVVEPPNPFVAGDERPAPKLDIPKDAAADWYHPWRVTWTGTPWHALQEAWDKDSESVMRLYAGETWKAWPREGTGAADEAARIAAIRWVEARWSGAVRSQVAAWKAANGLRGPIIADAPLDADLSVLSAADAANHPAPLLSPHVTGDPWVNAYGVGFLLRLTADLGRRIPLPILDFTSLPEAGAPWAKVWLDEAVRNGVQGLTILPPKDAAARAAVESAVKPLDGPNVYLPPPSEIGILVSRDTLAREPGAWVSLFRAYAALRAAGLWPDLVSDNQVRSGAVPLARFNLVVVPAARWASDADRDALLARAERGGLVVLTDPAAFGDSPAAFAGWKSAAPRRDAPDQPDSGPVLVTPGPGTKVVATFHDGAAAITERRVGDGYIMASVIPLTAEDGAWATFWTDAARRAAVPRRPWLGAVTMQNVGNVTGTYRRPSGP